MFHFTSDQLQEMVAALIWPLTRILGLIAAAPLFGNNSVPTRLKVWLGILLTFTISPLLPRWPGARPDQLCRVINFGTAIADWAGAGVYDADCVCHRGIGR